MCLSANACKLFLSFILCHVSADVFASFGLFCIRACTSPRSYSDFRPRTVRPHLAWTRCGSVHPTSHLMSSSILRLSFF